MKSLYNLRKMWNKCKGNITATIESRALSRIAYSSKFIQRSTSILKPKDFIQLMTTTSLDSKAVSLEGLCAELRNLNPECDLRSQSLMERINRPESSAFLKAVFYDFLQAGLKTIVSRTSPHLLSSFTRVFIEDCSECVLNEHLHEHFKGSSGVSSKACVKLDFIYEIKQKNIFSVDLTDRRSPDQKLAQRHLGLVQKGDLWIRDLGFFDGSVLKTIAATGAFFLSRLPASVFVYLNKEDKDPIDLAQHINLNFPKQAVIDQPVFVTTGKFPVRLVAYRVTNELAQKRWLEAVKAGNKKGRKQSEASLSRVKF
jgi:hypothetical protein